ncbi:helix-turn-helix transcriptional regulator [Streptomyces sp. NBC_01537]|uniref:helix-turn-helix domain-containing protein n=1 Tax=Streptomyces sp. NBC_01537 TaxID=2903896 RepID=UPI00386D16D0
MRPSQKQKKQTSPLRLVGSQLALFRRVAGLTQRELAERLCVSEEWIGSIEQGRRPLKPDLAEQLDALLDTKGVLAVAAENLPEQEKFPVWAEEYMDIEQRALALSWYDTLVVPGLLQTENYARAVFRSRVPALGEDEIEQQVASRVERQEILHRKTPPTASFVISQAILMDRLGGREVYAEQLRHLRESAELPGLTFQIMPFGRETHAGLAGPFTLLETPEHTRYAYTETNRGSHLTADGNQVSSLGLKYAMLRSQALNPEDTRGLLDRLLGER